MQQHTIGMRLGARKRRKRVGRGNGSGSGNYSGRGMKGQNSRSGGGVRLGFEGGQLPLIKRLPMMRGFTNPFRVEYCAINLDSLARSFVSGSEVTPQTLIDAGIAKNGKRPIKILGRGDLKIPLVVSAQGFSKSARQKIEAAGGTAQVIL